MNNDLDSKGTMMEAVEKKVLLMIHGIGEQTRYDEEAIVNCFQRCRQIIGLMMVNDVV